MGNSLLDFVLTLVRDPEVAARYARDPAGVLADAQLTGVTVADVDNLIPVVTDSLAAATPAFGSIAEPSNVWASGAAAVAFDAFGSSHQPVDHGHVPAVTVPAEWTPDQDGPVAPVEAAAAEETLVDQPFDHLSADGPHDGGWQDPPADLPLEHHPGDIPGSELL
jgi:hypothetical protein